MQIYLLLWSEVQGCNTSLSIHWFGLSVVIRYLNVFCAWTICDWTLTLTGECFKLLEQCNSVDQRPSSSCRPSTSSRNRRRAEHFIALTTRHHRQKVQRAIQWHAVIIIMCLRQPVICVGGLIIRVLTVITEGWRDKDRRFLAAVQIKWSA